MVCLESPDKAQPKISKKKKKEKLNLSLNTDKSNDILENIENKYKNGTGTQHESSRKAKKKKQKRGITESVQTEISEIEANLIMGNHEHCEDGSGNPKRKKKKKRELIESSNSEIDEIITEKKSVGLEESEKLNKSTGKKRNRDSKQSSRCIDGSQATVTDENSDEKITRKSAKKSKKKKQKKETNNIQRDDENEPTSDERVIQESPELAAISCNDQTVTSPQELCTDINKKSKKSQKKKCLDNADVEVSTPEPPVKPKKSRKRKKMDSNDAGVKGEAQESTESCDMLPKKKHKKHTSEDDNVQSDQNSPSNDKPSKVKKKKSKKVEMSKEANTEDLPVDTKVEINEVADETPINACENTASVTKKRKKKSKHKEANSSQLPDPSSCKQNVEQKKKKSSSASPPSSKNDVSDTDRECSGTASSNNDESELQHDARSKPKKHKKSSTYHRLFLCD